MANKFAVGKRALGICDRCGFRYKLAKLKLTVVKGKETGLKVCPECYEVSHPQLELGRYPVNDAQALREPRPDTAATDGSRDLVGTYP